jgi:four helix bundle protein
MSKIADDLRRRTFRYTLRIIALCRTLPDEGVDREIGRQLLRAGMGVTGNYWSACRGRSDREFIAKVGVSADEADESVLWLAAVVQSGTRTGVEPKALLAEGKELRAILSKSHKTARDNRQRKLRLRRSNAHQITNSPTLQFTKSIGGSP